MRGIRVYPCIKKMYDRFIEDEVTALSAQLAYYFLLSLFPFLIFLITILGYSPISYEEVIIQLKRFLPYNAFILIRDSALYLAANKNRGLISFGIVTALWAASNGVGSVTRALNKAYDEEERRPFWKVKGLTMLFTIALALIIMFSFILLIFGQLIGEYMVQWFHLTLFFKSIWNVLRYLVILPIMVFVFAYLYKYMPCRKLRLKEVMPGAIFTTVGWIITSLGFAYYVNNFTNYSKLYGSIGGVIVLMIWLFLSAIVIILGGELNATLTFDREGKEKPQCKRY